MFYFHLLISRRNTTHMEWSHFTWKCLFEKRKMYAFHHYHEMISETFFLQRLLVSTHLYYFFFGGNPISAMGFWNLSRGAVAENGHVSYEI